MSCRPQRFLGDSLLVSAARNPDKIAIVEDGVSYLYSDLEMSARKLASALIKRGLQRQDRVAIFMGNTWQCVVAIYAVSISGGVFLLINAETKADKLRYILNDSDAKILISDSGLRKQIKSALTEVTRLESLLLSGEQQFFNELITQSGNYQVESLDSLINEAGCLAESNVVTPIDLAALIYTSGSTGEPKGVMHTHLSMTFALGSLIEYLRLQDEDVMFNVLPVSFDYGLYQLLMAVHLGATLILEKSIAYPASIFKVIKDYSVTSFPGVPTLFSMLITIHRREPLCFPSVTRVTNTAAALPVEYVKELKNIFPNALIYRMYGLTECKRVSYLEPEMIDVKSNSVGKAIPGTEVFILDEDGQSVAPGETGILYVRGPHVMSGYWKKQQATDFMLKPGKLSSENMLCTHDRFYADKDGYLYFVGRTDDMIKTRGEKVSPVEIENVLHAIPGVREAAVLGVEDELLGSRIRAYVSLDEDIDLTVNEIKRDCSIKLENFMVPQEVIIIDNMPKTDTGKVSKRLLTQGH